MKQTIKTLIVAGFLVLGASAFVFGGADVSAANAIDVACQESGSSSAVCDNDTSVGDVIGIVVNTLLFVVGLISVIMIIIGGIRYTISAGDTGAVTGAKNTILYAVVGLVVAFVAYAIVNWVLQLF